MNYNTCRTSVCSSSLDRDDISMLLRVTQRSLKVKPNPDSGKNFLISFRSH